MDIGFNVQSHDEDLKMSESKLFTIHQESFSTTSDNESIVAQNDADTPGQGKTFF